MKKLFLRLEIRLIRLLIMFLKNIGEYLDRRIKQWQE